MRKLVGWDRYESPAALAALQALYADVRLFQNLFQPSMKLRRKSRHGSRLRRHYDGPQTPWARVRACAEADPVKVAALQLAQRVTRQPRATLPKVAHPPRAVTPWRDWMLSDRLKPQRLAQGRTALAAR